MAHQTDIAWAWGRFAWSRFWGNRIVFYQPTAKSWAWERFEYRRLCWRLWIRVKEA